MYFLDREEKKAQPGASGGTGRERTEEEKRALTQARRRPAPPSNDPTRIDILEISEFQERVAREAVTLELKLKPGGKPFLKYISLSDLMRSGLVKENEDVRRILGSSSDLVSGVYEGGFKIWECTYDLINYLENNPIKFAIDETTRVLDLGCGSGLLGLYSLGLGANVSFQDFNLEVLNFLTIPNLILNTDKWTRKKCEFIRGSWDTMLEYMNTPGVSKIFQFDYILTSETVYNLQSNYALYELMKQCLKPSGTIFLAAKTHYFGVGGGSVNFLEIVDKDNAMDYEVAQVLRDGVQRIILSFKLKKR